ncbi:PAS domain S-box protein [Telluribacter sp. SYSU D00476]|uniref:PAS domain S-box protein n=1 Tax=Telluribacter sp. SYSU D00476 TaxID=2811430 RepID=UPI001FF550FE|nr:PAS domain S-box protein [Telluribacter sp. SYSU D00476]
MLSAEQWVSVFTNSSVSFLVLKANSPFFTIEEVNESFLTTTGCSKDSLLNKSIFDAFPANPEQPDGLWVSNLRAALEEVVTSRTTQKFVNKKYDIPVGDTPEFETRFWNLDIHPVLNSDGQVEYICLMVVDVTDQTRLEKKAQEQIIKNEEKTNLIMNAALDAIICIDKAGSITYWNPQSEKIFGWKAKEVMGLNISDVIVPQVYRKRHDKGIDRYNQTGHGPALNVLLELSALKKNGKDFPVELTVLPIKQDEGEEFFCAFIRDISGRKKQESEVLKLSERLMLATQASADAIWDWDIREGSMYRSEGYSTLYGYDFFGKKWPDYFWESKVHADDLNAIQASIQEALTSTQVPNWTGEYRFQKADGTYAFVRENIIILRDQGGVPNRIVGALKDITTAKEQEQALQKKCEVLRGIIDSLPDMIYAKDLDLMHVVNNTANLKLLGAQTEAETLGKPSSYYFPGEVGEAIREDDLKILQTGEGIYNKEETILSNGEKLCVVTTKVPLRDKDQNIIGIAGTSKDLTLMYKKQEEHVLIYKIVSALGKLETLDEALAETLRLISGFMDFKVGEAWLVSYDKKELIRKSAWLDEKVADIFSYNYSTRISYGAGVPGSTWQKGQLQILNDIQDDNKIRRTEQVRQAGLNSAIGLPIKYQGEVIAVLTFMAERQIEHTQELVELMRLIAGQTALNIQRKKTEDELNSFFNHSPDILCVFGKDGYFKKINAAATTILDYSQEELLSRPYLSFVHPDDLDNTQRAVERLINLKSTGYYETRYITGGGEERWLAWTGTSVGDEDIIFAIGRNITDRKKLEGEVAQYNQRIINILESITEGFIMVDRQWVVTYWNREAERIIGLARKEALGVLLWAIFPEAKALQFHTEFQRAFAEQVPVYFEEFSPFTKKWVEVSGYPSEVGLSIFFRDITEQKQAQQSLMLSEQRFRALVQDGSDMISIMNVDGYFMYASPSTQQVLGFSTEEFIGKHAIGFVHEEDHERILNALADVRISKRVKLAPFRFKDSENNYRWIETVATDLTDDPAVGGIVTNSRDVTDRVVQMQEREKLIEELTQTNVDLKQFTYITSHNFRAPLSNLLGLLSLMEEEQVEDPLLQEMLIGFRKSTYALNDTINDLIKVLIIKDNPAIGREPLLVAEQFDQIVDQFRGQLEEVNADLETNFEEAPVIRFNRSYMESIFLNLLTNAVKYRSGTRPLRIRVSTHHTDGAVLLRFEDNGLGIDIERYKDRLFGLYQRFHDRPDSKGLGLYLIKSQMEALGGSISIDSKVNEGTSLTLTFRNDSW